MRRAAVAAGVAAVVLLGGCSLPGGDDGAADSASSASSTTATPTPTPPPVPQVGQCYPLDYAEAAKAVSTTDPVDCRQAHTAVTAYVGTIDPYQDGHLLTVDSARVQQRIARACPARVDRWLGGSQEDRRLSQARAIWFSPSLKESEAGASWFRCDVVAPAGSERLADLTGVRRGVLDTDRGRDRLGTCSAAAAGAKIFPRVVCAATHTWRAISTVEVDPKAKYLAKDAEAAADQVCRSKAQDVAPDPLEITRSFEWPSAQDWQRGQRYGLCWVPDKG